MGLTKRGSIQSSQEETVRSLFRRLATIEDRFDISGEQIWGFGFDPAQIPMLFVCHCDLTGRRCGITAGPVDPERLREVPGADFEQIEWSESSEGRDIVSYWVNAAIASSFCPLGSEGVGFTPELAEQETIVFDVKVSAYHPDSWEFERFVVHESFHHHQLFDAHWQVPVGYDPATPPVIDPRYSRLAAEEGRLIEQAPSAHSDDEAIAFARRFIALRLDRYRRWPLGEMVDRGTEQVEGSARYVENRFSHLSGTAGNLGIPPEALRADRDWLDFGHSYRTGARMLELLDRLEVDWKKRLINGEDPFAVLCAALGTDGSPREESNSDA